MEFVPENALFLTHFPNFGGQNFFPKYPAVTHNFIREFSTLPKLNKKLMIQFQESNQTDRKTDRKTKGQLDPIL